MGDLNLSALPMTEDAKRVIDDVADRAFARLLPVFGKLNVATAEMLAMLSMLRWERKVGLVAIENLGVDVDSLARKLDAAIHDESCEIPSTKPKTDTLPSGQRYIVVDTDNVLMPLLKQAEVEAAEFGHGYIGTEHLLLALIGNPAPRLAKLLEHHHLNYVTAKREVLALLGSASLP